MTESQGSGALPLPLVDRARGCLLGLAVGDALGTTLEFSRRDSLPPQSEMTGGGTFGLQPGEWTDDTAMALALGKVLRHAARSIRVTPWTVLSPGGGTVPIPASETAFTSA